MRESAEQWNATHRIGPRVAVILRSGETVSAKTATHAQQWGEFALVTLDGVEGHWTIGALSVEV